MIGRLEVRLRWLRRAISRSEWFARLLRLPISAERAPAPGLVMLQIDGLSRHEFEKSLAAGEMRFLTRLLRDEAYRTHEHYPGVPASTAPVQGELFYGVRHGVPGFSFLEPTSGYLVRMYEPGPAARAEQRIAAAGDTPLLSGGSAYADNFAGGAAEPHFCPSAQGWGPALRGASHFVLGLFIISNLYSFLRIFALLLLEGVIAVVDFARGLIAGEDLPKELKFIPTRLAIVILMRELATIGAKIDVARGLPIVHVNFLGYDEQAHRRGPDSRFAHWSLKGIDDAIARIWRAAHRSNRRHYDVWIYSDHGQETATAYEHVHQQSFDRAVADVFAAHAGRAVGYLSSGRRGVALERAHLVGGERVQRLLRREDVPPPTDRAELAITTAGPLSFIYCATPLSRTEMDLLAEALVKDAKAPVVLTKDVPGRVTAWTDTGRLSLPEERATILGPSHPYLDEAAADLIDLCHHADAGDFVVSGWRAGRPTISFAVENGAHGGFGPNETRAFALLPDDTSIPSETDYVRPKDLRRAALSHLKRGSITGSMTRLSEKPKSSLRIVTYNVHGCVGMDGTLSPERIARVIARCGADIVALQELDAGRRRSGGIDQAHRIAQLLEMEVHFHPAIHVEEERYGDAILTHLPMRMVRAGQLPTVPGGGIALEPRGALWVAVCVGGTTLNVINTHLGLFGYERKRQMKALLGPDWLGDPACRGPVVLCGDFNAFAGSTALKQLEGRLRDAQTALADHRPRGTFFSRYSAARIDHVYVDPTIEILDIEVPAAALNRVASDHLPLVVEFGLRNHATPRSPSNVLLHEDR